jgi:hypothetical protein
MWAYTIGLTSRFDHAELVTVDMCCVTCAHQRVNELAGRVKAGQRFAPGDVGLVGGTPAFRIGAVHADEWSTDRFNGWLEYHTSKPSQPPLPDAVQVLWRGRRGFQDESWNPRWPADCLALAPSTRPRVDPGNLVPGRNHLDAGTRARWRPESRHARGRPPRRRA